MLACRYDLTVQQSRMRTNLKKNKKDFILFFLDLAPIIFRWIFLLETVKKVYEEPLKWEQCNEPKLVHKKLCLNTRQHCAGDVALAQAAQRGFGVSSLEIFQRCLEMVLGSLRCVALLGQGSEQMV